MDLGLKGLNALVTGGSKGIGRHCAEIFAAEGANVSICARDQKGVTAAVESAEGAWHAVIGPRRRRRRQARAGGLGQ